MEDLRYPIGTFSLPESTTADQRQEWIRDLAQAPTQLRAAVAGLTPEQIETPYRPGGWTVRQVIHHVPDSHLNSYCRFRLALTEENPPIKAYNEAMWAELYDARTGPVEPSLRLLESLHTRWVCLLVSLSEDDWSRTFHHSDFGPVRLDANLALYAWHSRHHTAHIQGLRDRMGWK